MPEHPTSSTANESVTPGTHLGESSNESSKPTEDSEESNARTIVPSDADARGRDIQPNGDEKPHQDGHFTRLLRNRHKNKDIESGSNTQASESEDVKKPNFTVWSQIRYSIFNSWINLLMVCAPIGIALHFVPGVNSIAVFVVNFIAIIPLAATLSYATEEIAIRTGETIGGLLNATFGYVYPI